MNGLRFRETIYIHTYLQINISSENQRNHRLVLESIYNAEMIYHTFDVVMKEIRILV